MFDYYVDIEINLDSESIKQKNDRCALLFNTIHGILRSSDETKIGLSFPKFSASKHDKIPTLGRIFRLVSNSLDSLNDIIGKNSIDNLMVSKIITIHEIKMIPKEKLMSFYVFKRHHPAKDPVTKKIKEGSLDECVKIPFNKNGQLFNFYVKKVKITEIDTDASFNTYGLGKEKGPIVPVF